MLHCLANKYPGEEIKKILTTKHYLHSGVCFNFSFNSGLVHVGIIMQKNPSVILTLRFPLIANLIVYWVLHCNQYELYQDNPFCAYYFYSFLVCASIALTLYKYTGLSGEANLNPVTR